MDFIKVSKSSQFVFTLACLAAVAMMFVSEGSYRQSIKTLNDLGEMGVAHTALQELHLSVLDAESGQRGYLLTNRKEYLQPYDKGLNNIDKSLKALDLYYGDKPESTQKLVKLHSLIESKLSELALTINLHNEGKAESAIQITLSNIGRDQMDDFRTLSAELLERETRNVTASRNHIYRTLLLSRIGMSALSAISLLALFMYLRQSLVHKNREKEMQRSVQVERDRLEIEVVQRTAQLTELTYHLQTAREDERHRLARNLHDELGALLTSAKLDAARIKSRLAGRAPEALELLGHLVETLNSGIALGRSIIEDLRPSALGNLGLVATLEILAREFAEHSGVQVHCALEPVELEASAELMVYRLVQEAITNITKYARAKRVWISLGTRDGYVEVSVRDDGVGFDTTTQPRSAYGLVGMRFRVEAEGGTLILVSAPGQGAMIRARLPQSTPGTAQEPMRQ
ncbi:MAG: CHASE3 domain-containing protein [Hydrogenophaga sp.]|uniref:CHASE3 domain-containing protein n=1 Tax=Hydrogenophaga sp. TaxID=1904254 RepID=UPI0027313128|nr:CHASE3 domain-containing protein [Hydrogenophaga sp.]MDP2164207.1 CHASE3 domain-containing protein [Hydrogenophaga sp.]